MPFTAARSLCTYNCNMSRIFGVHCTCTLEFEPAGAGRSIQLQLAIQAGSLCSLSAVLWSEPCKEGVPGVIAFFHPRERRRRTSLCFRQEAGKGTSVCVCM